MADAKLSPHAEREVAVRAGCDPRTVRAFLEGRRQHSTTSARIAHAIEELGLAKLHSDELKAAPARAMGKSA